MFSLAGIPYDIANEAGRFAHVDMPVRIGAWRGNAENHNLFFLETMIDEAAAHVGQDPLAYRLSLLNDDRSKAVLERAAELADWPSRGDERFMGVCFMHSKRNWKTRLAVVTEISLNDESEVRVENIICVADSGRVINPILARQNLEGGTLFGLNAAIEEEIEIENGAPIQQNFDQYSMLRLHRTPNVEVDIIEGGEEIGAFGEVATPAIAPSLGNALYAATGTRYRDLPFGRRGAAFA